MSHRGRHYRKKGLCQPNRELKPEMNISTRTGGDGSTVQVPTSHNAKANEMRALDTKSTYLLPHQRQAELKSSSYVPKADSRTNSTGPPNHILPPHLRWSGKNQTIKSPANNKEASKQGQTSSTAADTNPTTDASTFGQDKPPIQAHKVLDEPTENTTRSCVSKQYENIGTLNCSSLPGVGSKTTLNAFAGSIAASSPGPSSGKSPTQIFPFHLRKTHVSSLLIHSNTATKPDHSHDPDSTGLQNRSELVVSPTGDATASLEPHLGTEQDIPAGSAKLDTERDAKTLKENLSTVLQPSSPLQSPYLPPHLKYKALAAKQLPDLTRSWEKSTPKKTTSVQSSSNAGGVALSDTCKTVPEPQATIKAIIPPPPNASSDLEQSCAPKDEEEDSNGWVQGSIDEPPKFVEPRIYSDPTIKTHSTQKYGSDVWDEWANRRKPGPLRSLCISDDNFKDDVSTKNHISAALAEYPRGVIRLVTLEHHSSDANNQIENIERPYVLEDLSNAFVEIWRKKLPEEVTIVNTRATGFKSSLPINIKSFMDAIVHPETIPNVTTDNKIRQETWTSQTAAERRQKKRLNIARRRQRQKKSYFVPYMQPSVYPFDSMEVPAKPYIKIHIRPVAMKDISGITAIYNQWISNSYIPEDQYEVSEENIKAVLETARKGLNPFIVAIRGDSPVGGRTIDAEDVVGFAMVESRLGFGGAFGGQSRSTGYVQLYVHQGCLRHCIGGHLLDHLLRRVSRMHVPYLNNDIWVNPTNDALYEQAPKRFHQIVVQRPMDKPTDADFMWFGAFMAKYKFFESYRAISVGRKPSPKVGEGIMREKFLDIVTYHHEAEIANYVE